MTFEEIKHEVRDAVARELVPLGALGITRNRNLDCAFARFSFTVSDDGTAHLRLRGTTRQVDRVTGKWPLGVRSRHFQPSYPTATSGRGLT